MSNFFNSLIKQFRHEDASPYVRQKTTPMIVGKLVLTIRGKPAKKGKKKYRQTMEEWRKKRWHL